MSSDRSFKLGSDEMDTASISSYHKRNRLSQLISQQHRNAPLGSSLNIPEVDQLISNENNTISDSTTNIAFNDANQTPPQTKSSLNIASAAAAATATATATATLNQITENTVNSQPKNMSKAAVLRHLFFSQISSGGTAANIEPTTNIQSSKPSSQIDNSKSMEIQRDLEENSTVLLTSAQLMNANSSKSTNQLPIKSEHDPKQ